MILTAALVMLSGSAFGQSASPGIEVLVCGTVALPCPDLDQDDETEGDLLDQELPLAPADAQVASAAQSVISLSWDELSQAKPAVELTMALSNYLELKQAPHFEVVAAEIN